MLDGILAPVVAWRQEQNSMSQLRPETVAANSNSPCLTGATAYFCVLNAVKSQAWGLIHGRLHNGYGHHCAIGSFFAAEQKTALQEDLIDEVAAVNDSCPGATPKERRTIVMRWLRWKLKTLGFPSYARK